LEVVLLDQYFQNSPNREENNFWKAKKSNFLCLKPISLQRKEGKRWAKELTVSKHIHIK
jgi:hypothetical protein